MLGSATGAIIELLQYFSSQQELQRYIFWTMGSLQGTTWREIGVLLPLVVVCWVGVFVLAKPLNALLLGEEYAQTMGVSVNKMKIGIIVITAILAGSITAFCGPIAFVGTAVPHLARWLFRTSQHHILLVGSILIGILVLLVCQWLAHLPLQNRVLPVNALTSLLGAPVVIIVVMRLKNS
jgi:iron complex transport system permease protein